MSYDKHQPIKNMQESINIEVELRGQTFDIEAEADYEVITSECTSEVGDNPYCTEYWGEIHIESIDILRVDYWTDSNQFKQIPVSSLLPEDRRTVEDKIADVIHASV